jgi:hypothetical protein
MTDTLFDIRRDTREILALLLEDEDGDEQADEDDT